MYLQPRSQALPARSYSESLSTNVQVKPGIEAIVYQFDISFRSMCTVIPTADQFQATYMYSCSWVPLPSPVIIVTQNESLIVYSFGKKQYPILIYGRRRICKRSCVRSLNDTALQALQQKSWGLVGKWLRTGDFTNPLIYRVRPLAGS